MAMSFTTLISVFVICICYIVMAQSAENEHNWNYLGTPRPDRRLMKRMMESRQREDVGSSSRREISKKIHLGEGSSSTRKRLTGKTKVEFEPKPEIGGIPKRPPSSWTNKEQRGLIRLAYKISAMERPKNGAEFKWKLIEEYWNREWNDKKCQALKVKFSRMLEPMLEAAKKFDEVRGFPIWSEELEHTLLRIYFKTENGDKAKHGDRIFAEWRKLELPFHDGMTPKYFLERADAMLDSVKKFNISDSRERTTIVRNHEQVEWEPDQDEYFRYLLLKHPYDEPQRMQNIYNEAQGKYKGLKYVGDKKMTEHLWDVYPELLRGPFRGSSHQTTHSQYHSFIDDYSSTSLNLGNHPHHGGMTIARSHPVQSYNQPDLELRLNSLHVGDQNLDTELKLGYPSHQGGHY